MAIKESLKNVAGDLGDVYGGLQYNTLPQWQGLRNQMYDYYNQQQEPYRDFFKGMVMDPSQRGYDAATVNEMRGSATGALAGARRSQLQDINRNVAASGMGNTGLGVRAAMQSGRDYMAQQRTANRDVDLAQAEAKRNDLWNAQRAWEGGLNMGSNMFNQQMAAAQGQQGTYEAMARTLGAKVPALTGAHNTSFWGNWGDVTGGIRNLMP